VCIPNHKIGDLVTFTPFSKDLVHYPYATCGYEGNGKFALYECIDFNSYPSWNDFDGYRVFCREGQTGIVTGVLGIPPGVFLIAHQYKNLDLNVYRVLIGGYQVNVFGIDLT